MHISKGSSEKPEGEQEVESDKGLPSSYCTVYVCPVFGTLTVTNENTLYAACSMMSWSVLIQTSARRSLTCYI
jgi:hypothetical protein